MSNKTLTLIILGIIAAIVAIILIDYLNNQPGKRGGNPYEYKIADFESVDSSLIHYNEVRNIAVSHSNPEGFTIYDDVLYIVGDQFLQAINEDGEQMLLTATEDTGTCIAVNRDFIYIGFKDHIGKFTPKGKLAEKWEKLDERSIITSIALKDANIYAADAGNRRVLIYNTEGKLLNEFRGKSESTAGHGFIIPSPYFDLAVNAYGDLWVANPGEHAIENYTDEGEMRGYWQNGSMDIEGFIGCCNPAEFNVMDDGSFVTSEKGMVRIKVYDESGKLLSVVAPPSRFEKDGRAPEVAVDSKGNIYALDFDRKMIRIFEKK